MSYTTAADIIQFPLQRLKIQLKEKCLVLIKVQKEKMGTFRQFFKISAFHFKHEHTNCENVISEGLKFRFQLCYHLRRNIPTALKAFHAFLEWELHRNRISALKRLGFHLIWVFLQGRGREKTDSSCSQQYKLCSYKPTNSRPQDTDKDSKSWESSFLYMSLLMRNMIKDIRELLDIHGWAKWFQALCFGKFKILIWKRERENRI